MAYLNRLRQAITFPRGVVLVATYLLLVSLLRYTRVRYKKRKFGYTDRASLASMTNEDAYKIQRYIMELEFPFTAQKALEFALFRTYGIPTISKLLVQTGQLSDKDYALKRIADTEVLLVEFIGHEPDHDRALAGIARMNQIHAHYQKAGKISNDDMLYTLSLFALEPVRWVRRYEWRELEDWERCAFAVFWKSTGDAMGIDFGSLPSAKTGWRDGLHWMEEVEQWSLEYEAQHMVPNIYNKKTADQTTAMLVYSIPAALRGVARQAVSALMDDRLRKAMMYPPPPQALERFVLTALKIRQYVLRYLSLPRPYFMRIQSTSEPDTRTGRIHRTKYDSEPWYVKRSLGNRWSLQAWQLWLSGKPIPGDRGDFFRPQGWLPHEVGPAFLSGKGKAELEADKKRLAAMGRMGCPMAFGR